MTDQDQEQKHTHAMEKLKAEFEYSEQSKKTPFPERDSSGTGFIKAPKMPYFDEDKDYGFLFEST